MVINLCFPGTYSLNSLMHFVLVRMMWHLISLMLQWRCHSAVSMHSCQSLAANILKLHLLELSCSFLMLGCHPVITSYFFATELPFGPTIFHI